jgi:hypothetical protein
VLAGLFFFVHPYKEGVWTDKKGKPNGVSLLANFSATILIDPDVILCRVTMCCA